MDKFQGQWDDHDDQQAAEDLRRLRLTQDQALAADSESGGSFGKDAPQQRPSRPATD